MDSPPASPKPRLRLVSRPWPFLSAALLILELIWPSPVWISLLILLGGVWLLAVLWTRSLGRGLRLERRVRYGWAQVGDRLEELFTITNRGLFPGLWLVVEDHSTLPGRPPGRVTSISGGEVLSWRSEGTCTRRGLFTLGPTSLVSGDPLGLCRVEIHQPGSSAILVLPPVLRLPGIAIASGGQVGAGRRPRRSALEVTVSAESVREYIPGDPLKAIHWPTSARHQSFFVRQLEHEPSSDWCIVLDMDSACQVGDGQDSTDEHGILLAASLASRGIREGRQVSLWACGPGLSWLPPGRSPHHMLELLRLLALLQRGAQPVGDLLSTARSSLSHGASLLLITPDVSAAWAPALLDLVKDGLTPTVLLLDPASFGGEASLAGALALLDAHGIRRHVIRRELFNQPEARPGSKGKWEWRVVGPGKAVPVQRPEESLWRRVA